MKMIFTCFADADGALRPALAGSGPVFADWQRFLPLEPAGDGTCRWRLEVDVPGPFEYKFVLLDESGAVRSWEEGFNQVWPTPGTDPGAARTWHVTRIPRFQGQAPLRMAGVAVPVFSLRSRAGFGIGEFADLKPLSDWAARSGLRVVQVLPVNDTSATFTRADSYPYSAVSAFALHPFYIHLQDLFPSGALPPEAEAVRASLEALPAVDYEQVAREKMRLLRAAYAMAGEETLSRPDFQRFLAQNASWLRPYAAFCLLRDRFGTADFTRWPEICKWVLILLMFCGGCAGSTGGGIKLSRIMILFKSAIADLKRISRPRNVVRVQLDGQRVENETIRATYTFISLGGGISGLSSRGMSLAVNRYSVPSVMVREAAVMALAFSNR